VVNAVERFEAMLSGGKDTPLLRFTLGSHYLGHGEPQRAAEHLRMAVSLDPDYSAAWKLLGRALEQCGDSPQAIDAFRRGIEVAEGQGDKQAAREMAVFMKRLLRDPSQGTRT
jgi:predicted Zn-dependent protease